MANWREAAPPLVSIIVTIGFMTILGLLLFAPPIDSVVASLLNVMLGVLGTCQVTVVNYWVGSSAGSREKDQTIKNIVGAQP